MRIHHALLTVPLAASLLMGSHPPAEASTPPPSQEGDASSAAEKAEDLPEALTQYPGAPFEDRKGHLWFATVLRGVVHFDGETFTTYTTDDGLAGDIVRGILEDKEGKIWIATNGGVSTFDGTSLATVAEYEGITPHYTFGKNADHLDVWDLLIDRKGRLWITTLDGVFRYDGKRFVAFPMPVIGSAEASEFTPKFVYSLYEDKSGTLWFGTDGAGAVRYDGETMQVYTAEEHGLCSNRVCTILKDRRGDTWFGTSDGGVSRFDGTSFTTHLRSETFSRHTGWGRFMAIHEDRAGNVWFGVSSAGGGVYRFDGKTFRRFTDEDGLNGGGVPSIREDRSGKLWFGTTEGVFILKGERFVPFTRKG